MLLSLELAREKLLRATAVLLAEYVPLTESQHRILAQSVIADMDFPPFDRSPLDGYAVIADDIRGASPDHPICLKQLETVPAGSVPRAVVTPGMATRIMTGAPIPPGATGIVRLEDTSLSAGDVYVCSGQKADHNICRKGEEIAAGEQVVAPGVLINAGVIGMLATLGTANPLVYRRPRVAFVATGSEITAIDQPLSAGKIRNSNSYMLSAQAADCGAQVVGMSEVTDSETGIEAALSALPDCELVVTTGGASIGDYDLIGTIFQKMGVSILFERVRIKPGMPVIAGVKGSKLYIGLSGNPAAASISFEQLVRPVLLKMGGCAEWRRPRVVAKLAKPFPKPTDARRFVWAHWWQEADGLVVEPLRLQGNGMLKSAMAANALIVIPENSLPLAAGTPVEIELLTTR